MKNREFGTFPITANYELQVAAPFDARQLVKTKAALMDGDTWRQPDGNMYIYSGMLVMVIQDQDPSNNGAYILNNEIDYDLESSWTKLADTANIEAIQEQIDNLEISAGGASIEVDSYTDLPKIGAEDTTYYVKENGSIYRYDSANKRYVSYGGTSGELDINLIYGGNANG